MNNTTENHLEKITDFYHENEEMCQLYELKDSEIYQEIVLFLNDFNHEWRKNKELGSYVYLRIGDIDDITPTVSKSLEILKKNFTVLTTCRQIKMTSFFIWDFERIEIKPLSRIESLRLFHRLADNLDFESVEHARIKVYDTSEGNPKMIVELCHRLSKEGVLVPETVTEICDNYIGRQVNEIDMNFILLFVMGGDAYALYWTREPRP